jgi:hypothetical protein
LGDPIFKTKCSLLLNNETYIDNEIVDVYLVIFNREINLNELILQEEEVCDAKLTHFKVVEDCLRNNHESFVTITNFNQYKLLFDKVNSIYKSNQIHVPNLDELKKSNPINFDLNLD